MENRKRAVNQGGREGTPAGRFSSRSRDPDTCELSGARSRWIDTGRGRDKRFRLQRYDSNIHDTESDFNDTIARFDTLFQCDGITLVLRDVGILAASGRYHEAGRQAPMRPSRRSSLCPNVRVGAAIMETL